MKEQIKVQDDLEVAEAELVKNLDLREKGDRRVKQLLLEVMEDLGMDPFKQSYLARYSLIEQEQSERAK